MRPAARTPRRVAGDAFARVLGPGRGSMSVTRDGLLADPPSDAAVRAIAAAHAATAGGDPQPAVELLLAAGPHARGSDACRGLANGLAWHLSAAGLEGDLALADELHGALRLHEAAVAPPDTAAAHAQAAAGLREDLLARLGEGEGLTVDGAQRANAERARRAAADTLAAAIAARGFAGYRAALGNHSRNLAARAASLRPGLTRRERERLCASALTTAVIHDALDFWETGVGGQSRVDLARTRLYVGCCRELGIGLPAAPMPPR